MEHEQVAELLSDIRARPTDAEWAAIDEHMNGCSRCVGALAVFGASVAGELALLRFELAGHTAFFAGAAAFGIIGGPLLLGVIATAVILSHGGSAPPPPTPTPTLSPSPTATVTLTSTPSETPTLTVAPTVTPTAPPAEPPSAKPTAGQTHAPLALRSGPDVAPGDCATFVQRLPSSGAGFNHEFEDTIVSMENQNRHTHGLGNLMPDAALYNVAANYARTLVVQRAWEQVATDQDLHNFGSSPVDRLHAGGISGWTDWSENLGYVPDGIVSPCAFFDGFTPNHVLTYLGHSYNNRSVIYPNLYHGTACYIDYSQRMLACVQDFISRDGPLR